MIYELRRYVPAAGKAAAMAARFRDHTAPLLKKLGKSVVASWESADGNGEVWYVIAYDSLEDCKATTAAFLSSEEWKRAKELTEVDGPLIARVEAYPLVESDVFASGFPRQGSV
jgi:hypothetical protein